MALVTNVIKGSAAQRLLLLVHGYGADEQDLGGLLPYLDPDGIFAAVLPRGPVAAPGTPGFAWYEFGEGAGPGFATALAELDALVDEQCEQLGFDRAQAIFGGFSQGAGLAAALGLFLPGRVRPAGVLAMSPALPAVEVADDARAVPVFVAHGTHDPLIPVQRSRELARANTQIDAALNNMSQGLCVFDKAGQLVICNERYLEMYQLSADAAKPGSKFVDLLECRLRDFPVHARNRSSANSKAPGRAEQGAPALPRQAAVRAMILSCKDRHGQAEEDPADPARRRQRRRLNRHLVLQAQREQLHQLVKALALDVVQAGLLAKLGQCQTLT